MVEEHLSLLRISDMPVGGWLVYAGIMRDTEWVNVAEWRPGLKVPCSPDDEQSVFGDVS